MRTRDQNSWDKGDLVRAVVLGAVLTLVAVPALAQDIGEALLELDQKTAQIMAKRR
jgi:hypothetical protein